MDKQSLVEMNAFANLGSVRIGIIDRQIIFPLEFLMHYAIFVLRPSWFHSDRFHSSFKKLLASITKYCSKIQGPSKYVDLAVQNGFVAPVEDWSLIGGEASSQTHVWQGIINPVVLGLLSSDDPKDEQFVQDAMSQYSQAAFPGGERAFKESLQEKAREMADRGMPPLLSPSDLPDDSLYASMSKSKKFLGRPKKWEPTQFSKSDGAMQRELVRYVIMLTGEIPCFVGLRDGDRWQYTENADGSRTVDINSAFAREAACLQPDAYACVGCQPEFRELLSTISYVRSRGLPIEPLTRRDDPEKGRYYEEARKLIVPFVDAARSFTQDQWNLNLGLLYAPSPTTGQEQDQKKALAKLQGERDEARRKSDSYAQELSKQKEETARVRKKLDTATLRLERAKEEADKQAAQTAELKATVKELSAAYDDLNEQFIASLEEQDDFLDDEFSDLDESPSLAGVRERIGEDAYQKLAGKKLVIVGGHENTQAVLRNLFPDWRFYGIDGLMPDSLPSADAIVVLARYVSHSGYQKAKSTAKTTGIPLVIANYNGPTSICRTLAAQII